MNNQSNRGFIMRFHSLNSEYQSIQVNLNKNYNAKYNYFEMKTVTSVLESFKKLCVDLLQSVNENLNLELLDIGFKRSSRSAFKERSTEPSLIRSTPKDKLDKKLVRQDLNLPRVRSTKARTSKDKLIDEVNIAVKNSMQTPIAPDNKISRFNKFINYKDISKDSITSSKLSSSNLKEVRIVKENIGFRNEKKIYVKPGLNLIKPKLLEAEFSKSLSQVQLTDNSQSKMSVKEKRVMNQKKDIQSIEQNSKAGRSTSTTSGIRSPQLTERNYVLNHKPKPTINTNNNEILYEPQRDSNSALKSSRQASPQISKMLNNLNKRIANFKASGLDFQLQD